jgi:predicted amidohydrolase
VVSAPVRIAVAQLRIDEGDLEGNAARCGTAVAEAAASGADLLVLPECALTGYRYDTREDAHEAAIALDDPRLLHLAESAATSGVTIVVGFLERNGAVLHNCAAVLGADGAVHHVRKTHLPVLGADRFVSAGHRLGPVVDTPFGRLGVAVCYDLRFPEVCRVLALGGADVIAVPVNWSTDVAVMAEHVVATRAVENRVYVAVADRTGVADGVEHLGASQVVGPDGTRLTAALDPARVVAVATVAVDLHAARTKATVFTPGAFEIDVFADRRPELYGSLSHPACHPTTEEQSDHA